MYFHPHRFFVCALCVGIMAGSIGWMFGIWTFPISVVLGYFLLKLGMWVSTEDYEVPLFRQYKVQWTFVDRGGFKYFVLKRNAMRYFESIKDDAPSASVTHVRSSREIASKFDKGWWDRDVERVYPREWSLRDDE